MKTLTVGQARKNTRKVKRPAVISSIFGKSYHFPFPYFALFILQYFPFHVVYNGPFIHNFSDTLASSHIMKSKCGLSEITLTYMKKKVVSSTASLVVSHQL